MPLLGEWFPWVLWFSHCGIGCFGNEPYGRKRWIFLLFIKWKNMRDANKKKSSFCLFFTIIYSLLHGRKLTIEEVPLQQISLSGFSHPSSCLLYCWELFAWFDSAKENLGRKTCHKLMWWSVNETRGGSRLIMIHRCLRTDKPNICYHRQWCLNKEDVNFFVWK